MLSHRYDLSWSDRQLDSIKTHARAAQVVLLEYGEWHIEAVKAFDAVRKTSPSAQILLALKDAPVDLAVELMCVGATDIITLPADADVLLRKVVRAETGAPWPAIALAGYSETPPEISPDPSADLGPQTERRGSFRVRPVGDVPAFVVVALGSQGIRLPLRDLSVGFDQDPGGISFLVPNSRAGSPPFVDWADGDTIRCWLEISNDPGGIPLTAELARIVREPHAAVVAARYEPTRAQDGRRIRRYWVNEQRKLSAQRRVA